MPLRKADEIQPKAERRRTQRVKISVLGRYMLEDRREFPCQVVDMSPGGLALIAPQVGELGERVIAYIDNVGRIEGRISRVDHSGFSMTIVASARKRDKLASQLTWLANKSSLGIPEDRAHPRFIPADQMTAVRLESGAEEKCRILDLSASGVAVVSGSRPPIGSKVHVGNEPGRVVRHLGDGFAVEFSRLQNPDIAGDVPGRS